MSPTSAPSLVSDTTLDDLPLRDDLRGHVPYGAPQLEVSVRLNTNENSHDVPPQVVEAVVAAIAEQVPHLNRYPDREADALRDALAAFLRAQPASHGVPLTRGNVWAANGSNEVLQQLLQAFGGPGRTAVGFTPSYSMHPIITETSGTAWVDGKRGDGFSLDPFDVAQQVGVVGEHGADVVFLTSPNNPTGTALPLDVVEAAYEATRGIVIVDEAYAEFARPLNAGGTPSAITLLPGRPRLVVTRTMSKAFAFAGTRVGYLAADPAVVDALRLVRLPYHLSSLTQAAATAALAHADVLLATVEDTKAQRDRLVAAMPTLGLFALPSDANFVLVGGFDDAPAAWKALLAHGVLVRDVGIPGHLRITAGTEAETDAVLAALAEVVAQAEVAAHPEDDQDDDGEGQRA
ncbi:histidinol-phosphate aminotransferase [Quadrisphaera granulorum]|uniref:Histidinol-phosphate aminotransferase n=1 Tax=Quadrisphaera granulorum TaxID=317664 RepID=A0A315ZY76_9ACTN|nr:histidinol-phosphate transaminase [Quadrisphaera granulorum]PWJ50253.1 histidinol-phosphate aminotransferase [Quadrisphaera granulorum]SZE98019.1 histidinol-phosphate aminotransferase [Quadrisphaera granulorum]